LSLIFSLICVAGWTATAQATDAQRKYTAYDMRNNGKIYVVVAVVFIIMFGLLLYVVRIDRRITKLEKKQ
jgi:CcmD family protein